MDLSADHGAIRARASALVLAHESVPLLVRTPLPVLIDCRSGTTVVTLLNCIYKGPCPPLYVYRLRFRPCSGTTSRFSSGRIASRSCSCLLPSLPCHFNFFIIRFLVWVSPTPTPRTKISIDVPVDRLKSRRSRLDCGTRRGPSGATQLDSDVFDAVFIDVLNRQDRFLWICRQIMEPFEHAQVR